MNLKEIPSEDLKSIIEALQNFDYEEENECTDGGVYMELDFEDCDEEDWCQDSENEEPNVFRLSYQVMGDGARCSACEVETRVIVKGYTFDYDGYEKIWSSSDFSVPSHLNETLNEYVHLSDPSDYDIEDMFDLTFPTIEKLLEALPDDVQYYSKMVKNDYGKMKRMVYYGYAKGYADGNAIIPAVYTPISRQQAAEIIFKENGIRAYFD